MMEVYWRQYLISYTRGTNGLLMELELEVELLHQLCLLTSAAFLQPGLVHLCIQAHHRSEVLEAP